MRKINADLQRRVAEAQASDDALANKCQSMIAFLEKAEASRIDRDDALLQAIRDDQSHFLDQSRAMRAELTAMIAELRGSPVAIETSLPHPAADPVAALLR